MAAQTRRVTLAALAGATVLIAATAAYLPPPRALLDTPATPLERSRGRYAAAAFALINEARRVVPPASVVTVTIEPYDSFRDKMTHRLGVALLPGRIVLPATLPGRPTPEIDPLVEYLVVVGDTPAARPGDLLLVRPEGTVWRRKAR